MTCLHQGPQILMRAPSFLRLVARLASSPTKRDNVVIRDGQIVFRSSCPLDNHSPQFGCPGLIPGGIIVSQFKPEKYSCPLGNQGSYFGCPAVFLGCPGLLGYHIFHPWKSAESGLIK